MGGIPHNIEKSAYRKGEFVGYANGVWRIRKITQTHYAASRGALSIRGRSLRDISNQLEKIDRDAAREHS